MAWRSAGVCATGQPTRAPMAASSCMQASVKRQTSASSRMRSVVTPHSAEIGLVVALPQSLYQSAARMSALGWASNPARHNRSTAARSASEPGCAGSPISQP